MKGPDGLRPFFFLSIPRYVALNKSLFFNFITYKIKMIKLISVLPSTQDCFEVHNGSNIWTYFNIMSLKNYSVVISIHHFELYPPSITSRNQLGIV